MTFTARTYKRAVQRAQAKTSAHFAQCEQGMMCPETARLINQRGRIVRRKRREQPLTPKPHRKEPNATS